MTRQLFSKVEPLLVPFATLSAEQQSVILKLSDKSYAGLPSALRHLAPSHASVPDNYCPVPFFGNIETARVATFSLNPSNSEFWSDNGIPFPRNKWRFDLSNPDSSDAIYLALLGYFKTNPLPWFDFFSYVSDAFSLACSPSDQRSGECVHLDVLPWSTVRKWSELSESDHETLAPLRISASALIDLIDASRITDLIVTSANKSNRHMMDFCCSFDRALLRQEQIKEGVTYSRFVKRLPSGRDLRVLGINQAANYLNKLAGVTIGA